MESNITSQRFQKILKSIAEESLIQAVLSTPVKKSANDPIKIVLRPITVKNKRKYQVSSHFSQKVVHSNLSPSETQHFIQEKLSQEFKQAIFFSKEADYHLLVDKKKQMTILEKVPTKSAQPLEMHNKKKSYLLEEGIPVPFLVELGIMKPNGQVLSEKYAKFRQINRFLEFIKDILPYLKKDKQIQIVDFGCGKAYLTFALYHYLHILEGYELNIVGLDLKEEVIRHCQALADKLEYKNLHFCVGDINHHHPSTKIDMVITLHACDTATDAALEKAVRWNTDIILSVPCCQHELYNQVENEPLAILLKHGILKEHFSALATDAARAQLLEILGYNAQVIEFIDLEHTHKNLLIHAVKSSKRKNVPRLLEQYNHFKKLLNIHPSLERRFQQELEALCSP